MTFEEIDACAKDLFSKENDASMWANIDEGDRAYWRKMAVKELEERRRSDGDAARGFVDLPDRRFFLLTRKNTIPLQTGSITRSFRARR